MSKIINSVFSDGTSCSESDDREDQRVAKNETEPPAAAEALIPSTRIQMNGSITVHRKHRKI